MKHATVALKGEVPDTPERNIDALCLVQVDGVLKIHGSNPCLVYYLRLFLALRWAMA